MTSAVKKDFLEEGYLIWPLKENSVEKEQLRTEVRQPGGLMVCGGWDRACLAEDRVKRRRDVIRVRGSGPLWVPGLLFVQLHLFCAPVNAIEGHKDIGVSASADHVTRPNCHFIKHLS